MKAHRAHRDRIICYPPSLATCLLTAFVLVAGSVEDVGSAEPIAPQGAANMAYLVRDINPGNPSSGPDQLLDVDGTLYFTANDCDGCANIELWKSDGFMVGTVAVMDVPGSGNPDFLTDVSGTLFFAATSPFAVGRELWMTNGAGAILVRDINPGTQLSSPTGLTNVDGTLFFSANDGSNGRELWKSDGTPGGTVMVRDITPGSGSTVFSVFPSAPNFAAVGDMLFFVADDGNTGRELWKSDGTLAGTIMVKDINTGGASSMQFSSNPVTAAPVLNMIAFGGVLLFAADDGASGVELWRSDGTGQGTFRVSDIQAGVGSSSPNDMAISGGRLFFVADNFAIGNELWMSDGTEVGTVPVADINPGPASSLPSWLTDIGGTLMFQAGNATNGAELWKSDGTQAGTVLVQDILPGAGSSFPGKPANVGGVAFFSANDGVNGEELWSSDGTVGAAIRVTDINPGAGSAFIFNRLANVDGMLFFSANDDVTGDELWALPGPNIVVVNSVGDMVDQNRGNEICDTGGMIGNDPECTLRAAIQESNARPDRQRVRFDIPMDQATGGVFIIEPGNSLPVITDSVTLNATTQGGYQPGAPVVELKGPAIHLPVWGFQVTAGQTEIRGFSLYGFGRNGILLEDRGNNRIEANIVGMNAQSNPGPGIGEDGILVRNSSGNFIGGNGVAQRNVVSRTGLAGTGGCGVTIITSADNRIMGNFIGTDTTGMADRGNGGGGVCLIDSPFNVVGGSGPGEGNVISGNLTNGIQIFFDPSVSNTILGNIIGLDQLGDGLVANGRNGIFLGAVGTGNVIGSGMLEGRNVISGNAMVGIAINSGPGFNTIDGNYIGTNAAGDASRPNDTGILIEDSPMNRIGVDGINVISGNTGHGVHVIGDAALSNQIQDNFVGTGPNGLAPVPNGLDGIRLSGARDTTIVGNVVASNSGYGVAILGADPRNGVNPNQASAGNLISSNWIGASVDGSANGNGIDGVTINDSSDNIVGPDNRIRSNGSAGITVLHQTFGDANVISQNEIFENIALGIDLGADFLTANDPLDADGGANALQNHPVITNIVGAPLNLVRGTLNSAPNGNYTIEIFLNDMADPSGNGEGQVFKVAFAVTTDGGGDGVFVAGFGRGQVGDCLSATARDQTSGDTSEFSPCVIIPPPPPPASVDFGDAPDSSGRYPTLLASDGARHLISLGVFMGSLVDGDPDGQPNADATGDDTDGSNDEGGVITIGRIETFASFTEVEVSVNAMGMLDAWVDFNGDGDWTDPSDRIFASEPVTPGLNVLAFTVPVDSVTGATFARFRYSTDGGLSPTGPALDGEVEDYAVEIVGNLIFADGFE